MVEEEYVYTKPEEPVTPKKSYKKLIVIPILIIIIVAAYFLYNSTKASINNSPENTAREWFDSITKGDWSTVFNDMVDENINYYSEECKNNFINIYKSWAATNYSLTIIGTKNCSDSIEYKSIAASFVLKTADDCVVIYSSYLLRLPNGGEQRQGDFWFLVKVENKWKVQNICNHK